MPRVGSGIWLPLTLLSLAGWAGLLASDHRLLMAGYCGSFAGGLLAWDWRGLELAFLLNPPAGLVWPWLLMLLAMMPVLLVQPVALMWYGHAPGQRARALALFTLAYLSIWMLAGPALMLGALMLRVTAGSAALPTALAIAVLWQCMPARRGCLTRCRCPPPLPASGGPADRASLRYGAMVGLWCLCTCWALMLVPLVTDGAHLPAMAIVSIILFAERHAPTPARPIRLRRWMARPGHHR